MGKDKEPRHVALAIAYSPTTRRVLMVTSRKHPHLWILPKGGIEDGETSGVAAVRESWEEAGTPPTLTAPTDGERLMMLALEPPAKGKRGQVWHVHAIQTEEDDLPADWPEKHERKRQWFSAQEALGRIHQWYSDPSADGLVQPESEIVETKSGKKARKGGAMETALAAFTERVGWTTQA